MSESLRTAQSILWMISKIKERGQFLYEEWAAEFREDEQPLAPRKDRKFHNHLKLFKEEALDLIRGNQDAEFLVERGRYYLERRPNEAKLESFADPQAFNFLPLLHGLNEQRSLVPFPSPRIEKLLIEGLDLPDGTLGRIIYKNATPGRFNPEFLDTFLDALASQTKLKIYPENDRSPCKITPLFLVNYEGAWHLLGLNGGLLQYNLSRVSGIEATDTPVEKIPAAKMQQLKTTIRENFGISLVTEWDTLPKGTVITVRYSGWALRYARERFDPTKRAAGDLWFQAEDEGESVKVTVRAQVTYEVISEVLRWGRHAEVVAPEEVRAEWLERIAELKENHDPLGQTEPLEPV